MRWHGELELSVRCLSRRARVPFQVPGLMVEPTLGHGSSADSFGSEISTAFKTIYLARLAVFKLKFGLKFLISTLQSTAVFVLLFVGGIMVLNGKNRNWDRGSLH